MEEEHKILAIAAVAVAFHFVYNEYVDDLKTYRNLALKHAQTVDLGDEGFVAKIPGFKGLLAAGGTQKQALVKLESALTDWVALALKRGLGLPRLSDESKLTAKA